MVEFARRRDAITVLFSADTEPRCKRAIVESTQIRLVVPPEVDMTRLLGQGDALLRLIEDQFESDIAVRGNQITISGSRRQRRPSRRSSPR